MSDEHFPVPPEVIRRLAGEQGVLNVFGTISLAYLLTPSGEVLVHDDAEGVTTAATVDEREFAYVRAAARYPELQVLTPVRPPDAVDCPACRGTGSVPLENGSRVFCGTAQCNSRGWIRP
ncbi:hypothetical protein [Actinoplanes philippinensis]|uniref:hypothetical protein n=1 Tax=Actinoplanes philippinensis TaxID=35752 RepID=UPI0033C796CB